MTIKGIPMFKVLSIFVVVIFSFKASAWGFMTGKVEVLYVNTYGNYSEKYLNGGYCFKLEGHDKYLKIAYAGSGEKLHNLQTVQSIVLAAKLSGKQLRATYVDWGDGTTCRVDGAPKPAKWLENLRMLD
jgi:hypothetical protein